MLTRALVLAALLAPLAAAEDVVPQSGCTQVGLLAYACVQEEATSCGGFTAVGAGVTG